MEQPFSLPAFTMADYNLHRLDDGVFWAFILSALAFCILHAGRRAFRQPFPTDPTPGGKILSDTEEEVERHTLFQRIFHWVNAIAVIALIVSGWMIYQPRNLLSAEGLPSLWFYWHGWGATLFLVGVIFHAVYESFIVHHENPLAVNASVVRHFSSILKNFLGLSKSYPLAGKYHPGQIFFHWLVSVNLLLLALTGFVIWKPFRDILPLSLFGLGWDFIFYNRLLHGFFSATLIGSIIGHIYFALFIKKNWPEAKSIVTGRIPRKEYLKFHFPESPR